jgi:hypothetical protein
MRVRVGRIRFQRAAKARLGLVVQLHRGVGGAQMVMKRRLRIVDGHCLRDRIGGLGVAAGLMRDQPEQVPGVGAVGIGAEDLAIELLGLRQLSALMIGERRR